MRKSSKIRTFVGFILAALVLLAAVWMFLSVGHVDFAGRLSLAVSAFCLLYAWIAARDSRFSRFFCITSELCAAVTLVSFIAVTVSLNSYARDTAVGNADADYLVVFGAGVQGETPSLMLTLRTRTAYEYLSAHPEARAVLSGGQGEGEWITESEAMRRMLVRWGIAEERLICEEHAVDTIENGHYSMALIADPHASVVAVSNAFHLRRCVQALTEAGAVDVRTLSAPLPNRGVVLSMYLREFIAVVYHAIFG
ncbi:MAG: YdcF family protein [Clostridiaceae bacterium]|nr:YdcF family protein [Clostridiaceae bacterium]